MKLGIETDRDFKLSGSQTGWTVIGQSDEKQSALLFYSPLAGTQSQPIEEGIPSEVILAKQEDAEILADKLMVMDEFYWPPFNPVVAYVEDGKVDRLVYPSDVT